MKTSFYIKIYFIPFLLQNCFPDHTFYLSFFRFCKFPFAPVFCRKNICI